MVRPQPQDRAIDPVVEGNTLSSKTFPCSGVLCLVDIASGMAHLHSLGILHGDLKGANVMLKTSAASDHDQRGFRCKLADFGLSRILESNRTHVSTTTYGTAA